MAGVPNEIRVKVIMDDLPLARALLAEHRVLHEWMVAKLLHTDTSKHWSDLVTAHDTVTEFWPSEDGPQENKP